VGSAALLQVDAVSRTYRRGARALDAVSFCAQGGATGLLGPNGAGKTTLQRVLASTLRPSVGRVLLDGAEQRRDLLAYRRRIGFLPQRFGFLPHYTVREFVEYVAWLKGVAPGQVPRAAADAMQDMRLGAVAGRRLRDLSGGMLRRVGLAQAVVNRPSLLLLDEPTVGLDPAQRTHLRGLLRGCAARMTIVLSTHLVEDVAAVCGQVLVIDRGGVRFAGDTAELAELGERAAGDGSGLERGYGPVVDPEQ